MTGANTLAYYKTTTISAVKVLMVQALMNCQLKISRRAEAKSIIIWKTIS
jgi:hypothetical protein